MPLPAWVSPVMDIGFFHLAWLRLYIMIVTFGLIGLTWIIMYRTKWGVQVRAVAQEQGGGVGLWGQRRLRVWSDFLAYGAGLAGVAGVLFSAFKDVFPDMGADYIVEAFLVVVVGGVGTLLGSAASADCLANSAQSFPTLRTTPSRNSSSSRWLLCSCGSVHKVCSPIPPLVADESSRWKSKQ